MVMRSDHMRCKMMAAIGSHMMLRRCTEQVVVVAENTKWIYQDRKKMRTSRLGRIVDLKMTTRISFMVRGKIGSVQMVDVHVYMSLVFWMGCITKEYIVYIV